MGDPNAAPDYGYVAYIDESGDPGLKTVRPIDPLGSSEWMMVAAVVIAAEREPEVPGWAADIMAAMNSRQMQDLHFARLNSWQKLAACKKVAGLRVRCFVVASNKQNMRNWKNPFAEQIPSDNWFYCWMTRILLERVTHWVELRSKKDYGKTKRVKLVFSERGGLSYSQMNAYFQWLRSKGDNQVLKLGNIVYETIDMRLMEVVNHADHPGLKLPDIVASAFFKAADIHHTHGCDPQFAKALGPRMAVCPKDQGKIISGYGVKLMPRFGLLPASVTADQRDVFQYYGYPRQWWAAPRIV